MLAIWRSQWCSSRRRMRVLRRRRLVQWGNILIRRWTSGQICACWCIFYSKRQLHYFKVLVLYVDRICGKFCLEWIEIMVLAMEQWMLQFIHIERRGLVVSLCFGFHTFLFFWEAFREVEVVNIYPYYTCHLSSSTLQQHTVQLRIILINCIREPSTGYQQGYYQDIIRIPGITAIWNCNSDQIENENMLTWGYEILFPSLPLSFLYPFEAKQAIINQPRINQAQAKRSTKKKQSAVPQSWAEQSIQNPIHRIWSRFQFSSTENK